MLLGHHKNKSGGKRASGEHIEERHKLKMDDELEAIRRARMAELQKR